MGEYDCETVKIINRDAPDGFIIINASDYDSSVHKLFGCEEVDPDAAPDKHAKRRR